MPTPASDPFAAFVAWFKAHPTLPTSFPGGLALEAGGVGVPMASVLMGDRREEQGESLSLDDRVYTMTLRVYASTDDLAMSAASTLRSAIADPTRARLAWQDPDGTPWAETTTIPDSADGPIKVGPAGGENSGDFIWRVTIPYDLHASTA